MKGISMPAVLQVIDLEHQSCSVQASYGDRSGSLHFRDGSLIHAQVGDLFGEAAALELLSWSDPEYQVVARPFSGDATLEANITQLLLEAARIRDESAVARSQAPSPSMSPSDAVTLGAPHTSGGNGSGPAAAAARPVQPVMQAAAQPSVDTATPLAGSASGPMDRGRLEAALAATCTTLGDALLAADICLAADGTSIAGYQSRPATCALFNQVATQISRLLPQSGLPALGRYLLAELEDQQLVLLTTVDDLQLTLVADSSRVQLGMLLNVVLPEIMLAMRGDAS